MFLGLFNDASTASNNDIFKLGKTLKEAIVAYFIIYQGRMLKKTEVDKQNFSQCNWTLESRFEPEAFRIRSSNYWFATIGKFKFDTTCTNGIYSK